MKHFKRSNMYKASNVTYDPTKQVAFSYDWWQFTANINGHIVFNNYRYSPSTGGHQSKVRALMKQLGQSPTLVIECPAGLQSPRWRESTIEHYNGMIQDLVAAMVRGRKAKNVERLAQIQEYKRMIDLAQAL